MVTKFMMKLTTKHFHQKLGFIQYNASAVLSEAARRLSREKLYQN